MCTGLVRKGGSIFNGGGILGNHIFEDGVLDNWSEDIRPGRCLSCQVICEFDCGWIA